MMKAMVTAVTMTVVMPVGMTEDHDVLGSDHGGGADGGY